VDTLPLVDDDRYQHGFRPANARAAPRSLEPVKPWRTALVAFVIDAALVTLFVLVGRRSHGETTSAAGMLDTLWPFLVGLVVGWLVTWAWRRPLAIVWPGVPVWLMTVALAMLIRTSAGQGVQPSFIAVAAVVLGVFLVGWRLVALPFARRRRIARAAAAVAVDRSVR
jgi:peptidoglycan/LPS O-acetylase OafA/YrhL